MGPFQARPLGSESQKVPLELFAREIGELGDAVDGGGVQLLVLPRPPHVRLEHPQPVAMLLRRRIRLPKLLLEVLEVRLRVEHQIIGCLRDHLTDQGVLLLAVN